MRPAERPGCCQATPAFDFGLFADGRPIGAGALCTRGAAATRTCDPLAFEHRRRPTTERWLWINGFSLRN